MAEYFCWKNGIVDSGHHCDHNRYADRKPAHGPFCHEEFTFRAFLVAQSDPDYQDYYQITVKNEIIK
jgi:hypothetical protein